MCPGIPCPRGTRTGTLPALPVDWNKGLLIGWPIFWNCSIIAALVLVSSLTCLVRLAFCTLSCDWFVLCSRLLFCTTDIGDCAIGNCCPIGVMFPGGTNPVKFPDGVLGVPTLADEVSVSVTGVIS